MTLRQPAAPQLWYQHMPRVGVYSTARLALECRMRSAEVSPETQQGFLRSASSFSFSGGLRSFAVAERPPLPCPPPKCHPLPTRRVIPAGSPKICGPLSSLPAEKKKTLFRGFPYPGCLTGLQSNQTEGVGFEEKPRAAAAAASRGRL